MKTAKQLRKSPDPRQAWIDDVIAAPSNDEDRLILVTGSVRRGKSTLAFKLGKLFDPTFDETRMVFDFEMFWELATDLPPGSVVIWDEIIEGGLSRRAMSQGNVDMVKFFTICGERNLIGMMLAPDIDMVDSFIRDQRATDWIMIPHRGQAKIHVRKHGGDYPGVKRGWADVTITPFGKEEGARWQRYLKRKSQRVKQRENPANQVPTEELKRVIEAIIMTGPKEKWPASLALATAKGNAEPSEE